MERSQVSPKRPGRGGAAAAWAASRPAPETTRTVQDSVEGAINWIRLACVLSIVVYAVLPGIPGNGRDMRLVIDEAVLLFYPLIVALGLHLPRTRAYMPAVATVIDPICITAMVAQTGGLDSEIYLVFFPAIASVALRYGGSLTAGIPCLYAGLYAAGCFLAGSLHGTVALQTLGWRAGYFVIAGIVVSVLTTVRSAAERRADLLDSVRTVTASILADETHPEHLRLTLMRMASRMGAAAVHLVRVVPENRLELLASGGPGASTAQPNTVLVTAFSVLNSASGYQTGNFNDGLSWLGVALWNESECTGVMLVETGRARISQRLTEVLPDAARALAVGLSKLQHFEQQQQRIEELDAINQILWDGLRQPTVESVLTALHRGVAQGIAVGPLRLVQRGQWGMVVVEVDRDGVRHLDPAALTDEELAGPASVEEHPQGELTIRNGVAATSVALGGESEAILLWGLPAVLPPRDRTFLTLASRAGAILLRTISLYEEVAEAASRSAQEVRVNVDLLESVRVLADRLRMLLVGGQRLLSAHGPDAVRQVAVEVALNLDAVRGCALVGAGGAVAAASGTLAGARLMTMSHEGSTLVWDHDDDMRSVDGPSMLWDTIETSGDSTLESIEAFVTEVSDIDDEGRTWLATLVQLTTAAMVNASLELRERMLDVQRERLRLAEDLHDTVAQQLYRVGLLARHASTSMTDARLRAQVDEIRLLASSATGELRRAISATTSLARSSARVVDDMLPHVQRLRDAGVSAEMVVLGDEHALPEGARRALVELAREGVQNVLKHSGARHAILRIQYGVREVSVTLEDDGTGGRQGGIDDGPSLGLRLIRQRLELLGGRLQAGPLEDGGFALRGHIPLSPTLKQVAGG